MKSGQVHIYTGNGKGKTTAAIGLMVRALGRDMTIYFAQFCKKGDFSELNILKKFDNKLKIVQFGSGDFVSKETFFKEQELAAHGFSLIEKEILKNDYDLIVLDEILFAVSAGLIEAESLISLIQKRPDNSELILTGRNAPESIFEYADLITVMEEKKHYFNKGLKARQGIEF